MMYSDVLMMMFADYGVLYKLQTCCDTVLGKLQECSEAYVRWAIVNNMHFNVSKTKVRFGADLVKL